LLAWEVTVKVYGVAVTMSQGYSRVPTPSTGDLWTWEPCTSRSGGDRPARTDDRGLARRLLKGVRGAEPL